MTIIHGMSNAEYHTDTTAISASGLKLFARSPAHYYAAYLDPNRPQRQPTAAMKLGTATHCAILEPAEFDARYAMLPPGINLRTNEGKATRDSIMASGRDILDADDMAAVTRMASAFRESNTAAALFAKPHHVESSVFATIGGVKCKCRPDFMTSDGLLVIDVKTTRDASPEEFGKSAWNLGYHLQAAFYRRVISEATGTTPDFIFGCVESEAPHLTAFYSVPPYLLEYADGLIDALLESYAECLKTDTWPGYGSDMQELSVPGYAMRAIENENIDNWEISHV
jgi:hypothetical protein